MAIAGTSERKTQDKSTLVGISRDPLGPVLYLALTFRLEIRVFDHPPIKQSGHFPPCIKEFGAAWRRKAFPVPRVPPSTCPDQPFWFVKVGASGRPTLPPCWTGRGLFGQNLCRKYPGPKNGWTWTPEYRGEVRISRGARIFSKRSSSSGP